MGLEQLPDEVVQWILLFSSPQAAVALERTSRRFKGVANEPVVWRHYCQKFFRYWDARHDILQKFNSLDSTDWKKLYAERHATSHQTTELLNAMLSSQIRRIEKIQQIAALGYDAKDALLRHMHVPEDAEDHLARRYWSNVMLGCLHRSLAIAEWQKLHVSEGRGISLIRAIGAFDLFVLEDRDGDLDDILVYLNTITQEIRHSHWEPALDELTPRQRALALVKYLIDNKITGIHPDRHYHNIEHNFLGVTLSRKPHNSLPLIAVVVFCYIAQQFGLDAQPCSFPLHVHAIVRPAKGADLDGNVLEEDQQGSPMYLDPFRSTVETPIEDLKAQLTFLGSRIGPHQAYLEESSAREITLRCARNIINSPHQTSQSPLNPIDMDSAQYAALWASMLLSQTPTMFGHVASPAQLRQNLLPLMELFAREFPNDVFLIQHHILRLFQGLPDYANLINTVHSIVHADYVPPQVKSRSRLTEGQVKYRVGQVFQHRRYGYRAIITGWDAKCEASEQWVEQMGVDRLKGGRNQSFYHSLVQDRSVRYVAEENIEIVTPDNFEYPPSFPFEAGKYFKRWDHEARQFVSNIESEYPDD